MRLKLHEMLESFDGVWSTPQWGGRAYKVGPKNKPKLFAFVYEDHGRCSVDFKLPPDLAKQAVQRHKWIAPHDWLNLRRHGWVQVTLQRASQLKPLSKLLVHTRQLLPGTNTATTPSAPTCRAAGGEGDPVAARIERVMTQAREQGLRLPNGNG